MSNVSDRIHQLNDRIAPLKEQIIRHPLYESINSPEDLQCFMKYHVFAVWDFMSLLKALQRETTCISLPWMPKGDPEIRYFINEIVLGEECDLDRNGNRKSHFEMYLEAMHQNKADTAWINTFIDKIHSNTSIEDLIKSSDIPVAIKQFMLHTFEIANSQKSGQIAAVFTFGREDLIPEMFTSIVNELYKDRQEEISNFKYYLERHIEIDGNHHSQLALKMTTALLGSDEKAWEQAEIAVVKALKNRISLWDAIHKEIIN
jgi:hypothetical protein